MWGVAPAYLLLRFVAFYYFLFSYTSSKIVYSFFRKKIGYGVRRSLIKVYQNYYLLGQSIIDKVVLLSGIPNAFTFHFDGRDNLLKMAGLQKGGLLLSAHLGNWEIAGQMLQHLDTRINIVMFDGEHRKIKEYIKSVTGNRAVNVILIKNDLSHIYAISEAFRNNELVCMHADRFMEGNRTLTSDFLGTPARFPMGPFVLAAKFKVPVSFVFAIKETSLHYHLFASEIKDYSHLTREALMQEMLDDFVGELENKTKKHPEQWYNYYNFWQ
jgi:predicted LPLAT superfamily acyltransferase